MCYTDEARPPTPPGETGKASGEQIVLTAGDGTQFHAYLALPEAGADKAIVIYPDVRGLHQFYRELALRFAEVGIAAIALDYFGRTAGLTGREEGFEFMPHVEQIRIPTFLLDVKASIAELKSHVPAGTPVFVTGFCMGGALVLLTGTQADLGCAGLIPFYAGMTRDFGGYGTVLDRAAEVASPVVGFFGGADQGIPETSIRELERKLDQAGVEHQLTIYPGAPHSFFDRKAAEFADASADAWNKLLTFIQTGHVEKETA
jgi:carboxymethylenebutenolidase